MSKPAIIAIGHYDDISRDRMTDRFEVTWVDAPADLGDLPDATRAAVERLYGGGEYQNGLVGFKGATVELLSEHFAAHGQGSPPPPPHLTFT